MAEIYSADQIVGKDLYANTSVPLKRDATDAASVVTTRNAGDRVGTVYSWLDAKPGIRERLYWMFNDNEGKPYYAEHLVGRFNVKDLQDQGALSVKEQIEQEKKDKENTKDFIERMLNLGFKALLVYGGIKLLSSFSSSKK